MINNLSIRSKANAFFVSLGLVGSFNFLMIIHLENRSLEDYQLVDHTHEVIELSNEFLSHMIDAEIGQRGYILTSNLEYLQPYYSGTTKARIELDKLYSQTMELTHQQARLSTIERLVDEKFTELQNTIDLKKSGNDKTALDIVNSNYGKRIMDEIRQEVEKLILEERQLLVSAQEKYLSLQTTIRLIFIIESVAFLIFLLCLSWYVTNVLVQPIQKISRAITSFKLNNGYEHIDVKNKDEIGVLAEGFNHLAKKISENNKRLLNDISDAQALRDKALKEVALDPLTQLHNRRFMEVELETIVASSQRYGYGLCAVMLDIDHFKKINDIYGHQVGDATLQKLASLLREETRESDLAIRYGGEEFLLILTHVTQKRALAKAEYIRSLTEALEIDGLDGKNITISLGVSKLLKDDESYVSLIKRADKALYAAKQGGRNRVCSIWTTGSEDGENVTLFKPVKK